MHARHIVLAVLAAAVTLTSVASAGPAAAKQRVAIDMKIAPKQTFVFTPLQSGALKRDSGRITTVRQVLAMSGSEVMRDGQKVTIFNGAPGRSRESGEPSRSESGANGLMSEAT